MYGVYAYAGVELGHSCNAHGKAHYLQTSEGPGSATFAKVSAMKLLALSWSAPPCLAATLAISEAPAHTQGGPESWRDAVYQCRQITRALDADFIVLKAAATLPCKYDWKHEA